MRQAVLALAFDHLGAEVAESEAFLDNPASNRVSLALGYEPNGFGRLAPRGVARETQRFRLTADGWRSRPRPPVTVDGLDGCLGLFGLPSA
jgi:RimJ/RimL family protein N-acetyltransferase